MLKIFLSIVLLTSAIISYFSELGVVFDQFMLTNIIDNIKEQNTREALELLSISLIIHIGIFAFIPILLLWLVKIKRQTFFIESRNRILTTIGVIVVCTIVIWSNMKYLTKRLSSILFFNVINNISQHKLIKHHTKL
jgi:lipid A ethanolaminephosphotransferase